jgi:hypothetical protein
MDVLTSLLMGATFKKARVLEQWLVTHRACYPAPALEFSDDNAYETGRCSCGSILELTVVIDLVVKEHTKCQVA